MFERGGPFFEYTPNDMDDLSFYYRHLDGREQDLYRQSYIEYDSSLDMMSDIICDRLRLYEIRSMDEFYLWPDDRQEQLEYLQMLPDDVIIEVGAAILGWVRSPHEAPGEFAERILGDLENKTILR